MPNAIALQGALDVEGGMQFSVREIRAERLNQPRLALTWMGAISQEGQAASKHEKNGSLQKEQLTPRFEASETHLGPQILRTTLTSMCSFKPLSWWQFAKLQQEINTAIA